jgi:hypothetical protein
MRSVHLLDSRAARAVALALAVTLPACGGGSDSPTPIPTPAGPSQANITVTCQGTNQASTLVTTSPRAGFQFRIIWPCSVTESAGLGANINFVRMTLTRPTTVLEVVEVSGNDIVASTGSNRINASSTRNANIQFDFNAGDATAGRLTFSFTDDRGNALTANIDFVA